MLYAVAAILLYTSPSLAWQDLWKISIDESPAPPVQDEPPFSQHASRNRALLKYQIPGLAAGYVGFMLILGLLYFTVGRRLRRVAESGISRRGVEMVKPTQRSMDPSPVSPSQSFSRWNRLRGLGNSPGSLSGKSGPMDQKSPTSVASFDSTVLEKDRLRQQDEMERLYAAVISNETKAPREVLHGQGEHPMRQLSQTHVRNKNSFSQRNVPQIQTQVPPEEYELAHSPPPWGSPTNAQNSAQSPTSPRARAIYPPYSPLTGDPTSPTSPIYTNYPEQDLSPNQTQSRPPMIRQSSATSERSNRSNRSNRSLHNLTITRPPPSSRYPRSNDPADDIEANAPLTPGRTPDFSKKSPLYTPFEDQYEHDQGGDEEGMSETLPEDIIHAYGNDADAELASPRPVPSTAPQRRPPQQATPTTSALRPNRPPKSPYPQTASARTSSNELPLRSYHDHSPTSANTDNIGLATTTIPIPADPTSIDTDPTTPYDPMKPFGPGRPRTPRNDGSRPPFRPTHLHSRRHNRRQNAHAHDIPLAAKRPLWRARRYRWDKRRHGRDTLRGTKSNV